MFHIQPSFNRNVKELYEHSFQFDDLNVKLLKSYSFRSRGVLITFNKLNDVIIMSETSFMDIHVKNNENVILVKLRLCLPSLDCTQTTITEEDLTQFKEKYLTDEELSDMFWFVFNSTVLCFSFYCTTQHKVYETRRKMRAMEDCKTIHNAFVLEVLKSLDFTGDVAKNVISKYL